MRTLTLIAASMLVTVAAATSSLSAASASVAPNGPATFSDGAGDNGAAADISTVVVSSDATTGQITFQVNLASALANPDSVDIFIDADQNSATGSSNAAGADYDFYLDENEGYWTLAHWNGSWGSTTMPASGSVTSTANQVTFSINRTDLGGTSGFNFWVDSTDPPAGPGHEDQAPNDGLWSYQIGGAAQALQLTAAYFFAPKIAKAGKTFVVAMVVQRSDTTGFLGSEGDVRCKAATGGKSYGAAGAFVTVTYQGAKVSSAVCTWTVPRAARGKTLRGAITASYQGARVTRTFAAGVK